MFNAAQHSTYVTVLYHSTKLLPLHQRYTLSQQTQSQASPLAAVTHHWHLALVLSQVLQALRARILIWQLPQVNACLARHCL